MPPGVGLVAWKIGKHHFTKWHQVWALNARQVEMGYPIFTRCGREIPTKGSICWSSDFGATVEPNETCKVCLERMAFHPEIMR